MNIERGYEREGVRSELQKLQQQIASFEAIENRRPDQQSYLDELHKRHEKLSAELADHDLEQAA